MSPASSGALEVERYIGACLISSQGRAKSRDQHHHHHHHLQQQQQQQQQQHQIHDVYPGGYVNIHQQRCSVDGWAGGMPLISFMSQRRRRPELQDIRCASPRIAEENHQNASSLSRLAIHTQGAPLILSGRYNHRKNKDQRNNNNNNNNAVRQDCPRNKYVNRRNFGGHARVVSADSISVASDESSGSANSENCLPRIIKPRKRRKKDRKPPHLTRVDSSSASTSSNSPEIEPYRDEPVYFCDFVDINNVGDVLVTAARSDDLSYVKVVDPVMMHKGEEAPKLHHSFEDVEEGSDEPNAVGAFGAGDTSSCQCRYCDPSGQIWDVDRRCYSPFLTIPSLNNYHLFTFKSPPSPHECLVEKMSNISLNNNNLELTSSSSSSSLLTSPPISKSSHLGDLEVSTEIVTSLNGHRDLEIKFFSASTTSTTNSSSTAIDAASLEHKNFTCANFSDITNTKNDVLLTVGE